MGKPSLNTAIVIGILKDSGKCGQKVGDILKDETFKNALTTHLEKNTTYTELVPPQKFLENMEKGNQKIICDNGGILSMNDVADQGRFRYGGKRKKKKRKPKRKTKRKKRRKTKRKTKRRKRRTKR